MTRAAMIRLFWLCTLVTGLALSGCNPGALPAAGQDVLGQAALEATAILQQAQATALVLQAQAQATAVMAQVSSGEQVSRPGSTLALPVPTSARLTPAVSPTPPPIDDQLAAQEVQVVAVGFAAEGGFIVVRFLAPAEEAAKWWQGDVSVTDEASGTVYGEVPVMPRIGPLIGRPKRDGQTGYVMLVNTPPGLPSGTLVTVKLGNYRFEHIPVQ